MKNPNFFTSLKLALNGIRFAILSQRNARAQLLIGTLACIGGVYFNITITEWIALIICCGMVLFAETMNTAIEIDIDLTTRKKKYRAKLAKDTAAGSVLIASITAMLVGYLIFYDRFVTLITGG